MKSTGTGKGQQGTLQTRRIVGAGISIATILAAFSAHAQTAPDPAPAPPVAAKDEQVLETITVTSRKKAEPLQQVPLAITAFTADQLTERGVTSLQDVANITTGMTMNDNGSERGLTPTIRGMYNFNLGGSPNVAVFLDGIYLDNPSAVGLGFLDFDRIEIVKGPVSSLYGRNAFAGAINYITKKPTDTFDADVNVTFGDHAQQVYGASISGPIQPGVLRMGLSVDWDRYNGTYHDDTTGQSAGGHDKRDVHASFDLTPIAGLEITGGIYNGNDKFNQPALTYLDNNCGLTDPGSIPAGQYNEYCGKITMQRPVEVANLNGANGEANKRDVQSDFLKVAYDLNWATASALFGHNNASTQGYADFTGHRYGIPFQLNPGPGTINLPELFGSDDNNTDNSVELRLASRQDQRFRWAGGAYTFTGRTTTSTLIGIDGATLPPGQGFGGSSFLAPLFLTSNGQYSQSNLTRAVDEDKLISEFGSAEFDLLPNLTASAEYRSSDEHKNQDIQRNAFAAYVYEPDGPPTDASFRYNNYRGALNYKLTPNNLLYASVADGTKAGGFNSEATIASEISYKPETNTTYEIGSKNTFLNQRLQINAAVFHIDSRDLQIYGPSADPHNVGLITKNFGGTSNDGFELELTAIPLRGVTVNAGLAYADPKFINGTYDFGGLSPTTCAAIPSCAGRVVTVQTPHGPSQAINLQGLTPPQVSKVNATFGIGAFHALTPDWTWFGRVDSRYESKQYSNSTYENLNYWGPHTTVDLRTGIEGHEYTLTFFVKNLTNNLTPASADADVRLNDLVGPIVAYLPPGRLIGVTASFKY